MGEFPSGQRGQTVNLLRFASMVRIRPLPQKKSTCFYKSIFLSNAKAMVYHQPLGCISSRAAKPPLYLITPLGVFQKFFCNDGIQSVALMICNSLRN